MDPTVAMATAVVVGAHAGHCRGALPYATDASRVAAMRFLAIPKLEASRPIFKFM